MQTSENYRPVEIVFCEILTQFLVRGRIANSWPEHVWTHVHRHAVGTSDLTVSDKRTFMHHRGVVDAGVSMLTAIHVRS